MMEAEGTRTSVVGIISDTHGLLRPEALEALQGSELILHAGDVGDPAILDQLAEIAPVHAVRGNVDHGPILSDLPRTEWIDVGGVTFYMIHILEDLDLDPDTSGVDVLVYGHSHRPELQRRGRVLFLNPGSAGPRRFALPVTVARATITDGMPSIEPVTLFER